MTSIILHPATSYSLATLNDIFVGSFQGYFVPIPNDLRMFAYRLRSEHIDLTESLVAEVDGQHAGISLTARRLGKTRLAGLGVYPEYRKLGIGQKLTSAFMQPALERQDEVLLECFQANIGALQLYQKNGFEIRRNLLGYSGQVAAGADPGLQKISLLEAVAFVREHAAPDLPWQISADTLISLLPTAQAYRLDNSVAILSQAGEHLYVRSLVTAPEDRNQGQATRLLKAIAAATGISSFQAIPVFPEDLIRPLAEKLGWQRSDLCQYELVYRS
ncbi:GNAT family N-acetyltransferase [Deinococcus cellulosilyticus]|uniref:N-acetyltransferase domain-containing protein n=1 Tax=Deinococcus cellulosilyticus (strain DSM 18568 / NBRC 106333 / KACC 11606 / 5516J-15) TaxID=1223518 RepID=A0A511NAF1_DEIC1|nr:GNAT family N-acetyltransferase [Deinococcus cellulosilyticus]GEM49341.1 hypothetical protein DC3_49760 [Deinococcus cellulosilyticus NBRC 106333 = KACC 11606]